MKTVKQGSQGTFVSYVQLALSRLGYPVIMDEIFGPATNEAVRSFQSVNGLTVDGIVGQKTWEALLPILRGYSYYTIKKGDTFNKIAQDYGTTVEKIISANPTAVPERLSIGEIIIVPYGFSLVPTNVAYTYFLTKLIIEGIQVRFPIIKTGSAGSSVMGNNLYYLVIGQGNNEVFYNGAHHANEWITTPLLLRFLEEYAEAYYRNENIYTYSAVDLFNATTLYMIPLVNPDGVDLVNEGISVESTYYAQAESIARNYPDIPFPDGWKANIIGIDTNLSYPAYWEQAREIKFAQGYTSPAPRDYVGTAPLSAKESALVYQFTTERNFLLSFSYHTQGKVIYWKFLDYMPENAGEIGEMLSAASGYTIEDTPYSSSFAGYKDWYIMTYNRPGYTIEAGSGINPLPIEQFPEIYKDNVGILAVGLGVFIGML